MKKPFLFMIASVFIFNAFAQEIKFETGNWAEIKAKAKKENKLIFMDAFTTWCGPCKLMSNNTFTNKEVADYYNANFINAKVDMEKGEGLSIAKEYKVTCYPNLVYINGDGKLIHRAAGYLEPQAFIDLGKTANTPGINLAYYQDKYDAGERNPEFLLNYLDLISQTCSSASVVATSYFASVPEKELLLRANWSLLYRYIEDVNAAPFEYLVKNRKAFEAKYTADSVSQKIFDTYLAHGSNLTKAGENADEKLKAFEAEIKSSGINRGDELIANIDLAFAASKTDWNAYFNAAKIMAENYSAKDPAFLNKVSWKLFVKTEDKKQLADAEKWAKKSTDIDAKPYNLDTYANLLFKNGKKEQAIATEKKALEMAIAAGEDTQNYKDVIAEFEK